jgi:hypothetical protein
MFVGVQAAGAESRAATSSDEIQIPFEKTYPTRGSI